MKNNRRMIFLVLLGAIVISAFTYQETLFGEGVSRGQIKGVELKEASGLTASFTNQGLLWSHNDSGDVPRIFLIDNAANGKAEWLLADIKAIDWEEITSFEKEEERYLLIGDIGDNQAKRPFVTVHRVKEPFIRGDGFYRDTIPSQQITSFTLKYEDGPRDAEAMFYDGMTDELYVISKRELQVGVYKTSLPEIPQGDLVMKKVAQLPFSFVTAASISMDAQEVLVKNLLNVYYWKREASETIPSMFQRAGISLPYQAEIQGEAIAFSQDDTGYFTLSESPFGFKADLRFYPRLYP